MRIRPRAHRWIQRFCLGLAGLCAAGTLAAFWEAPPPRVRDLAYGTVLYGFYQRDYFEAITRLMVAQSQERLDHHRLEGELLLGGLMLTYGLHDQAEPVFRRLLTPEVPAPIRNRAWYYLGRIHYQKGSYAQVEASLARIEGERPPYIEGERQLLLALTRMAQADFTGAAGALRPWRGTRQQAPYADFNLAVALVRGGDRDAGLALLDRLGRAKADDAETRALRDKANIAAAEELLRGGQAERARTHLDRVRLEGPLSNRALLWSGWASNLLDDPRRALVPWTVLRERGSTDPMVQEALLAVPHAYAELGDQARAAGHLTTAIDVLDAERFALRAATTDIAEGRMVVALVLQENLVHGDAAPDEARIPALGYLIDLLAGHRFQQAFQNYLDLHALRRNLDHWAESIDSFDDMLEARQARHALSLPQAQAALDDLDLDGIGARRDALAARFEHAERQGDAWVLATAEEQRRWQRLQDLEERLARLPGHDPQTAALRERQTLLRGLVRWEVETGFAPRLWESRKHLKALDAELTVLDERHRGLQAAHRHALTRFQGFAGRIETQRARIARLQPRVNDALAAHEGFLQALALETLENRRQTLDEQLLRARYALARIHDAADDPRRGVPAP